MRKFFTGLFCGLLLTACASVVIPTGDRRIFLFDEDRANVIFFPFCKKYKFWNRDECKGKARGVEVLDLTHKETRKMLATEWLIVHRSRIFGN